MRFRIARSARKRRIGNARIIEALTNAGIPTSVVTDRVKLRWVGVDGRGLELEIVGMVADEDADLVIIIHAMPTSFPAAREDRS